MSVSSQVVIRTVDEERELLAQEFRRGVARGIFETTVKVALPAEQIKLQMLREHLLSAADEMWRRTTMAPGQRAYDKINDLLEVVRLACK